MSDWTYAGEYLPWLKGQGLHIAEAATAALVSEALGAAGYAVASADTSAGASGALTTAGAVRQQAYRGVATALNLPATAGANLDALIDGMRELPERWPQATRLALLWTGADRLVTADLLGWTALAGALIAASGDAWSPRNGRPLVFETVAFVSGGYGADHP